MSEQEKILTPSVEQIPQNEGASVEQPAALEQAIEKPAPVSEVATTPAPAPTPAQTMPVPPELERGAEIERILESDLSDVYFNLPEDKREEFRVRGEATAQEINTLLGATKVKVHKIIKLIKSWLLLIPGVNKFFLEQEAKLKADQILKIKERF